MDGTHLVANRLLGGCNHQKRLIFPEQRKQGVNDTIQRVTSITTASTAIDDLAAGRSFIQVHITIPIRNLKEGRNADFMVFRCMKAFPSNGLR